MAINVSVTGAIRVAVLNRSTDSAGHDRHHISGADKIPRKGGPGITRSDLLVINKTGLAPHVGASLEVMDRDAKKMRGDRPFVFTCVKKGEGVENVAAFVIRQGLLDA